VYPKIELHVHLEATIAPATLLEISRRNDYPLPASTVEGLAELYRYRDCAHLIEVWILTTTALRPYHDLRQVVGDYAQQAKGLGAARRGGDGRPVGARRARAARSRPDPPWHPRRGGSRARPRAGGSRDRARRLPHLEPAYGRRARARRASVAATDRGRGPLLD